MVPAPLGDDAQIAAARLDQRREVSTPPLVDLAVVPGLVAERVKGQRAAKECGLAVAARGPGGGQGLGRRAEGRQQQERGEPDPHGGGPFQLQLQGRRSGQDTVRPCAVTDRLASSRDNSPETLALPRSADWPAARDSSPPWSMDTPGPRTRRS
jgi:hypothetical protein